MRHMTRAFLIGKIYIIAERYVNYCFTNHPYLWDESNFMKMIKKLRIMKGDKLRKHCQIFCPKKWDYRTISDFWKWSKRCLNDWYDRSPCIMAELSFKKKLWRYLGMKAARQAYPRAVKVKKSYNSRSDTKFKPEPLWVIFNHRFSYLRR